jgi:hypothetical protein
LAYRQSCPGREIRIIDYYEASGVDLGHYVRELAARPYLYAGHIVPHDAQAKELGTGKSRLEVLESLGLKNLQLAPLHRLEDGINAVRVFLPKMLVRCRKMRARHRRAQALSRCARARCTTGPRTPRIRFATSRSRSTARRRTQASIAASTIRREAWCDCSKGGHDHAATRSSRRSINAVANGAGQTRTHAARQVPHFVSTMITCLGVPDVLADMGLRLGPEDIAGLELAERFTDRRILSFVKIGIESPHLGGA